MIKKTFIDSDVILARNIKDYTFSELQVLEPCEFIALYGK